jgi:eukaryotic-like serine/threonine-protein kinase
MAEPGRHARGRHAKSLDHRIDAACDRFEADWRSGRAPRIEDFLVDAEEADRPALLGELMALERELRESRGDRLRAEEYLARFPAHSAAIQIAFGALPATESQPTTRPRDDAGRNLLFGVLALQNNFIGREDLLAAFAVWVADRARSLDQLLVDRGALDDVRRALLQALVAEHLKQYGGSTDASLAAVSSFGSVREELEKLNDPDLRASLAATSRRGGYSEATTADSPSSRRAGERFRILRFHRDGGLGRVYIARDEELGREVALKEIRPDKVAEGELRGRFVLEAEINGGLEHPGIVPVYSLGTYGDGRPFYAMRFVEGDSLKEAIESYHKSCPQPDPTAVEFRKLLGRFIDVCEAIAFAHSKGVLHRDLKPQNVMLGRFGETLLIDWGLAKATGRREPLSSDGGREATLVPPSGSGVEPTLGVLGSPPYMSPEQAAGEAVSLGPATDVYGLGAILFALLTGEPPVDGKTTLDILDQARRGAIRSPRSVNPNIPRAMEAVCLKALSSKPQDRYPSAQALAEEVEHWLGDEPVSAFPENLSRRLGRWARRHRAATQATAAVLVVVTLVSATAAILINRALHNERVALHGERSARTQAFVNFQAAQKQSERAEGNFRQARQAVDDSFTLLSEETLLDEPGLQPLRQKLLQAALAYHERFLQQRSGDIELKRELAASQRNLAIITAHLGRLDDALAHYRTCQSQYDALLRDAPGDVAARGGMAKCLIDSAGIQTDLARFEQAESSIRQALGLLQPTNSMELQEMHAKALYTQGRLANARRKFSESRQLGERAVAIQEELVARHPENARLKVNLSLYYINVGRVILAPSRRSEAIRMCQRACEIEEQFLLDNPESVLHRFNLGRARYSLAHQHLLAEHWGEAADALDAARLDLERVAQQNPKVRDYRAKLAETYMKLSFVQGKAGSSSESIISADREAARLAEDLHKEVPEDSYALELLHLCTDTLGQSLARAGRVDESVDWLRKSVETARELVGRRRDDVMTLASLISSHANLGVTLALGRRHEEAVSAFRQAIEVVGTSSGGGSGRDHLAELKATNYLSLAESLYELNRPAEVETALSEYRKRSSAAGSGLYKVASSYSRRISREGEGQASPTSNLDAERLRCAENAMWWLRQAIRAGYNDVDQVLQNADLNPLRSRPDYQTLLRDLAFPANAFAR